MQVKPAPVYILLIKICELVEISFRCEKFGKQYRAARRTAKGVVRKTYKLIVENVIFPKSARANRHTEFKVSVKLWLGTVVLGKVMYKLSGRRGEEQPLRFARIFRPSL